MRKIAALALAAVIGAVLSAQTPADRAQTEALRKDGMPMPISLSSCPMFDGKESPLAALVVVRDITEQRFAQAALAEVEGRVRTSEALAHVGSWLWDLGTGTVQWSDECHSIHGVDPLDFDGTFAAHLEVVHPDDRDRVREAMERSATSSVHFEGEYRVVRPDGEVRHIHARAQPTVGSAGNVLGLRGITQDVTARRG
jgi:PAS domain S-box-containing protein